MNYKHQHSPTFEKELKALSKKYKSLKEDIEKLKKEIEENPLLGTSLGGGYKKIRLNITSKPTPAANFCPMSMSGSDGHAGRMERN